MKLSNFFKSKNPMNFPKSTLNDVYVNLKTDFSFALESSISENAFNVYLWKLITWLREAIIKLRCGIVDLRIE